MKLYELTEAMKDLEQLMESGVPEDQLADTIEDISGDFKEKAESILFVIANKQAQAEAYKAEEKRLAEKRKLEEKQIERIKEYLLFNMQELDFPEVNNGILSAKLRKLAPSLSVDDEDSIPVSYKSIKTTVSVDKKELLKALKDLPEGESIEGATLITGKKSLTFK